MATVDLVSRMTRIVGVFTVALVAAIPLITLSNDAATFLKPRGMKLFTTPQFVQILIFGTTCAAIGEMMTSFVFSFVFMYALRYFVTKDGGAFASQLVREDVIKSVQENVFSDKQPTSL